MAYINLIPPILYMWENLNMISLIMTKQINPKVQLPDNTFSPRSSQINNTLVDVKSKKRIMHDYFREGYDS